MKKILCITLSMAAIVFCVLPSVQLAFGQALIVPIPATPGIEGTGAGTVDVGIGQYVRSIYSWGLGIAALAGVLMLIFGGAEYILSAGSFVESSAGKERIKSAIFGLIILLAASLILRIINPNLTKLNLNSQGGLLNTDRRSLSSAEQSYLTALQRGFEPSNFAYDLRDPGDINISLNQLKNAVDNGYAPASALDSAIQTTNAKINEYYSSPAYKLAATEQLTKANAAAGKPAPTEQDVVLYIEDQKIAARTDAFTKFYRIEQITP